MRSDGGEGVCGREGLGVEGWIGEDTEAGEEDVGCGLTDLKKTRVVDEILQAIGQEIEDDAPELTHVYVNRSSSGSTSFSSFPQGNNFSSTISSTSNPFAHSPSPTLPLTIFSRFPRISSSSLLDSFPDPIPNVLATNVYPHLAKCSQAPCSLHSGKGFQYLPRNETGANWALKSSFSSSDTTGLVLFGLVVVNVVDCWFSGMTNIPFGLFEFILPNNRSVRLDRVREALK